MIKLFLIRFYQDSNSICKNYFSIWCLSLNLSLMLFLSENSKSKINSYIKYTQNILKINSNQTQIQIKIKPKSWIYSKYTLEKQSKNFDRHNLNFDWLKITKLKHWLNHINNWSVNQSSYLYILRLEHIFPDFR